MIVPHMDVPQEIKDFHAVFEQLSGTKFTLDFCRMDAWRQFISYRRDEPYTHDDLRIVWRFLRKQIIAGKRNAGALKFRNMIQNPDYFEEDLAEARGDLERSSKFAIPATKVINYGNTTRIVENDGMHHDPTSTAQFFKALKESLR